ncbi:putative tetratricopeptide-like helical domain superfamily [Helianthus annuus]|nr:putative tetratricopeptide-like helical domain superfamily [Helianthus annuus]
MAASSDILSLKILENMFMNILQSCKTMNKLKKIHTQIIKFSLSKTSSYLVTKMVNICDQHEQIDYAKSLFKEVSHPNIYLYNAIIKAYTHTHLNSFTIYLYKQMLREQISPDNFTYPFVIRACGGLPDLPLSKQVHGHVLKYGVESNIVIENSLLDMYVKCGGVDDAHKVFDEMSQRDVICWNTVIYGYTKVGQMKKARELFEQMPEKSVVSWTAMISGYTRVRSNTDALDMFHMMQRAGVKPDWISLLSVLSVCTQLGALELGKWVHFYAERNGFLRKTSVCNALIEMYAKSGNIEQAWQVFDKMLERDVISWSTMVGGLATHGKARDAIRLFQEMQKSTVKPNEITFVGLLSACAHAGLLEDGLRYFDSMTTDYNLEPGIEHYGCLVDLLGRTGCLDQALEVIKTMPMKPDSAIWGSLLSACRTKGNLAMAVIAMEHLIELEPEDTGNYVLLSNIYADLGRWDGVSRVRKLIRGKTMSKKPGCSAIEVDNVVEEFVSGDKSKPFSGEVYSMLELLASQRRILNDFNEIMFEDM